jgi:hypothetical protein
MKEFIKFGEEIEDPWIMNHMEIVYMNIPGASLNNVRKTFSRVANFFEKMDPRYPAPVKWYMKGLWTAISNGRRTL